jgi:hypothetical protein
MSSLKEKRNRIQFVYKTTNLMNGTYYIGVHSTWNIEDDYLGSGKRLIRSVNKYGRENFKREILAFFETNKEAYEYESHLVNEELIKDELCLNLKPGGSGGFSSEQQKMNANKSNQRQKWLMKNDKNWADNRICKMKESGSNTFKKLHSEGKIKHDNFKGKSHTEESKKLMSESSKNKGLSDSNSQFGTCWITNGTQNMKIRKGDSIPEGWSLGRKLK